MRSGRNERCSWSLLALAALVAAAPTGCRQREGIRTYTVAEAEPAPGAATERPERQAPPRGAPRDRMVAAIVPAADRAWFLKATGSIEAMTAAAPPVDEFLRSVRLEDGQPRWETPDGWEQRDASGMRLATLVVPVEGGAGIELSVIGLPRVGDWSTQALDNVNRWRGQLGLSPWTAEELADGAEELEVAEGARLFDAVGWFDGGSMTPPFAGAAAPTARPAPPSTPPGGAELSFDTPDGWSEKAGSAMRKASLETAAGAEVTAFAFPAGAPAMSDPLANVNRWRGEVGLGPTNQEDLDREAEEIRLSGDTATYVEIEGEAETTLAAMTQRGARVWFFKLRGPKEAAASDRDAFREWLDSVEIAE